jgi:hypothetical protein
LLLQAHKLGISAAWAEFEALIKQPEQLEALSKMDSSWEIPPFQELLKHLPEGGLEVITGVNQTQEVLHHPLAEVGHTLLCGGSKGKTNVAKSWILELVAKNTPQHIQIAVIDCTPNADLVKALAPVRQYLAHVASDQHEIDETLRALQHTLAARQNQQQPPEAWLIVIEGITKLQSNPTHWAIVQALLGQGKATRMFVLATTRQILVSGPLYDAFVTHMTFAPDP